MGTCMGTCMGVVRISTAYQHMAVFQFMTLTKHQITEELNKERLVWFYSF